MATKLYLRASTSVPSGTLPTAEQSALTADDSFEATQTTNRLMSTTKGSSQTSLANTSLGFATIKNYYVARWVSDILWQSSISANTWTLNFANAESNAQANFPVSGTSQVLYVNCYVWNRETGTKTGTILDGNSAATFNEAGTAETVNDGTFTGAAVTGIAPGQSVLVFEMWAQVTQASTTTRTQTVYFDGTTENTTQDASVSNHASFLSTPEDLQFTATAGNMTVFGGSSAAAVSTANTTQYPTPWGQINAITSVENEAKITIRTAGTISRLGVRLTSNSIAGNTTFTVRKNGADTSIVATASASATGYFEDLTNSVSVAAGDQISLKSVPGAATGTFTMKLATLHFAADSGDIVQILAAYENLAISTASVTRYNPISGRATFTSTEANTKMRQKVAGTYSKLYIYVSANARTTTTTFKSRKNGADGNLSVSIGAGATGVFEDTTNSDTVSSGDDYNLAITTGTGTESLTYTSYKVEFTNTQYKGFLQSHNSGSSNIMNAAVTQYFPLGGISAPQNTEVDFKRKVRNSSLILSEFHIYLSSNTVSADSTATLMVNGVASALTMTLTANTAGLFSDTTHTVQVGSNDDIDVKIVTGATGTSMGVADISVYYHTGRISLERIYKHNILQRVSLSRTYLWNVLVTALERISLSRTYKYHVLGRVSLSRIYKYHILSRISLSRIYKYHVLSRTTLSRIYKWNIATRVSLSRIYKYNVRARVSLSRIYKYHLATRVSLARIYKYNLLSRTSLSRIYKYNVRARVSLSRIYKYNLIGRISLARIYKYNVIGRISLARIYKYHVLSRVSLLRIYKYNLIGRISLQRIYKYNVRARVSLSRIYRYNIIGRISLARIYKYNVLQRASLSRIYKYNLIGRVSLSRVYKWDVLSALTRISKAQIYKYHIATRVSLSRIYKYHLATRVSLARIYKYNVLVRASLSRIYKYNVLARVSLARVYKYNILARVSLARIYLWNVVVVGLTRIEKSQIYKWNMAQRVSVPKVYKYNILNRVSLARVYKYNILNRVSLARIYKYNILVRVSLSRIYKWNLVTLARVSREQILKYNIIGRISKPLTLRYNIASLAVTQLGKIVEWIYARYGEDNPPK